MKIVPIKILCLFVMVCTGITGFAKNAPPPPGIPPPPGLPINGGVFALFILCLIYGLYKIHQFNINKKTPI